MRILLTGPDGQLGQALQRLFTSDEVIGLENKNGGVTDKSAVGGMFRQHKFDLVIHAAALTNVDYCAEHPDEAFRTNAGGTLNLIQYCQPDAIPFVYISTNEVFNGQASQPYPEYAPADPINPYGYSKYAGEELVRQYLTHYTIVRTAWLYSARGKNFVHRILEQANAGKPLKVVDDEFGSPTYVDDLAKAITRLIATKTYGTFHLVNDGGCSRYDLAKEVLKNVGKSNHPIEPTKRAEFKRASNPPAYTILANHFASMLDIRLRPWEEAVAELAKQLSV